MKTREENRNNKRTERERFDWFIERLQTRVAFGWLSELSGKKTSCPKKLISKNQPILRFDVILQHDWPIEQCVFFGGKTKSPCFDLFINWLIKQITNRRTETFFQGNAKIALSSKVKGCTIQIFSNLALNCQPYKRHSKTAIKRCGHRARFLPVCP